MSIINIAKASNISEEIKKSIDINANIAPSYLTNETPQFNAEESNSIESSSFENKSKPASSFVLGEKVSSLFGNYISNDESDLDLAALILGRKETPSPEEANAEAADAVQEEIDDVLFTLEHGRMTEEEWNAMIAWLNANGLGWLAKLIAANPENAGIIFDMILDPEGYWDGLEAAAEASYEADERLRLQTEDDIAEALGLTSNGVQSMSQNASTYYYDAEGNRYTIEITENGVIVHKWVGNNTSEDTYYSLSYFSDFGLSEEQIHAFDSVDTRIANAHAENCQAAGLPAGFDPRYVNLSDAQKSQLQAYQNSMWISSDGDYLYVNPEFIELMEKLMGLYNILSCLFVIAEAKIELKQTVSEITSGTKIEKGTFSLIETAETMKNNTMAEMKYKLYTMQKYVSAHNNAEHEKKLKEAQEDAHDEARSGWDGFCNYTLEVLSLTASDSLDRDEKAKYQDKKAEIDKEYGDFQARVEAQYEKTLGKIDFDSGDPFGSQIDDLMDSIGFEDFKVEVGNDKWDLNTEAITNDEKTGIRDRLVALENTRKIWYMLQLAKNKLKETVSEITTGREGGSKNDSLIMGALNDLGQLEQSLVSNVIMQMQGIMTMHNAVIDDKREAEYYKDLWLSGALSAPLGLFAPFGKGIGDYIVEKKYNDMDNNINFKNSDLQISIDKIMEDINDARSEAGQRILNSDEEAARVVDELEKRQWLIIGALDEAGLINKGSDGFQHLVEAEINALRKELTAIQNLQRLITMLVRAKARLKEIVAKITTGRGAEVSGLIGMDSLDSLSDNKRMAFELKLSNLKNRIQEHNKQRLEKLRYQQSKYKMWGGIVGAAAAAAIIIASGGTGVVAAFGLFSALTSLGSSLGNLAYHAAYKVDDSFANLDFYGVSDEKISGDIVADAISRKEKETERTIDRLTNADASKDLGDGQYGLDAAMFMEINDVVKRYQMLQKIIVMLEQARQDFLNIVSATTTGISASDNSDVVKSALGAIHKDQLGALELKKEQIQDVISVHNRKVMAVKDITRSGIQAGISAASLIAGGIAGAAMDGATAVEGVMTGLEFAGYANVAVNLAYSIQDRYGSNLAFSDDVNYEIDQFYKYDRQSKTSNIQKAEKAALEEMKGELVVGIGGGEIAVDSAAFYRIRDKVDRMYNSYLSLATVAQARGRMLKSIARQLGIASSAEDTSSTDSIYQARESSIRNLDTLRLRLQNFVDRSNQLNDARKNLYIQLAVTAVVAAGAFMKYVPIIKDAASGSRITIANKINSWLKENFHSEKLSVGFDGQEHPVAAQLIGGEGSSFDGKIEPGDIAGVIKNVIFSQEFAQFVAAKIFDAKAGNEGSVKTKSSKVEGGHGSLISIDDIDRQAAAEEIAAGDIEIETAALQKLIEKETENWKMTMGMVKEAKNGVGVIRSNSKTGKGIVNDVDEEKEKAKLANPAAAAAGQAPAQNQVPAGVPAAVPTAAAIIPENLSVDELQRALNSVDLQNEGALAYLASEIASKTGGNPKEILGRLTALAYLRDASSRQNNPDNIRLEQLLVELQVYAKNAVEESTRGEVDLALIKNTVDKLVTILPQAEHGLSLAELKKTIRDASVDDMEKVLTQIMAAAKDIDQKKGNAIIEDLRTVSENVQAQAAATEFIGEIKSGKLSPQKAQEKFANLSLKAKSKVMAALESSSVQLNVSSDLLRFLTLGMGVNGNIKARIEKLAAKIEQTSVLQTVAADNDLQGITDNKVAVLQPEVDMLISSQIKKNDSGKISIKIENQGGIAAPSREGVIIASAAAPINAKKEGNQLKEIREEDRNSASIFENFGGLNAHKNIIAADRSKKEQAAVA